MTTQATLSDLTEAQTIALEALLRGATVTDAAKAAGVSRQTVSTWRNQDPLFVAALNAAARDQLRETHTGLRALAPAALAILAQELEAGGETASRAARDVLRFLERMGSDSIGSASPVVVRSEMAEEEEMAFLASVARLMPDLGEDDPVLNRR